MQTNKKNSIKSEADGVAYFLEDNFLKAYPILVDNTLDVEGEHFIEEAPSFYKAGHVEALRKLGVPADKIKEIVGKIGYYEEESIELKCGKCNASFKETERDVMTIKFSKTTHFYCGYCGKRTIFSDEKLTDFTALENMPEEKHLTMNVPSILEGGL